MFNKCQVILLLLHLRNLFVTTLHLRVRQIPVMPKLFNGLVSRFCTLRAAKELKRAVRLDRRV